MCSHQYCGRTDGTTETLLAVARLDGVQVCSAGRWRRTLVKRRGTPQAKVSPRVVATAPPDTQPFFTTLLQGLKASAALVRATAHTREQILELYILHTSRTPYKLGERG